MGTAAGFLDGGSWYSCVENLKTVKNYRMGFMFAVESNRRVSTEKGSWVQVQKLDVPEDGMLVWLREFGNVKLFRTRLKDQLCHYVVFLPDTHTYDAFDQGDFQTLHDRHWQIEQYHRMIKRSATSKKFQVRCKVPILNHIFTSLCVKDLNGDYVMYQNSVALANLHTGRCKIKIKMVCFPASVPLQPQKVAS